MEESFVFAGQWVPCRVCRDHLDIVANKVSPLYSCSPHDVVGMILLKVTAVISKQECPFQRCVRGESFSVKTPVLTAES